MFPSIPADATPGDYGEGDIADYVRRDEEGLEAIGERNWQTC